MIKITSEKNYFDDFASLEVWSPKFHVLKIGLGPPLVHLGPTHTGPGQCRRGAG